MKSFKYILMLPVAALALASCSDDLSGTDWAPGEISSVNGVYFAPENETYMTLLNGNTTASIVVKRLDNHGTLTVPVVVKQADPAMMVPASVTFADGDYQTTLDIDCSQVPTVVEIPFEVGFPDEYLNPYAAGAGVFSGTLIVSGWTNVSETGLTDFQVYTWNYTDAGYEPIQSAMYHLPGSSRYRVDNFLDTGIDFTFELIPSPLKEGYYRIVPMANQLMLTEYGWGDYAYYNSWWLVEDGYEHVAEGDLGEDDEGGWPVFEFTKANGDPWYVYLLQFLWYDDASKTEYCPVMNYDKGTPTAYMAFYGFADEEYSTYTTYYRIRFSWKEDREDAE